MLVPNVCQGMEEYFPKTGKLSVMCLKNLDNLASDMLTKSCYCVSFCYQRDYNFECVSCSHYLGKCKKDMNIKDMILIDKHGVLLSE